MDDIMKGYFDKGCKAYDSYTNTSYCDERERVAWQNLYSDIFEGHGSDVLNVGCGPGTEALTLADMGYRVTGLDFSQNMVDATRRNAKKYGLPIDVMQGDAEELPFPDCSFDIVVSNYALWAIPDPQKAMCEWMRVLRPGGIVAFVDGSWDTSRYSLPRKLWIRIAMHMRRRDGNSHNYGLSQEEREHLGALWSKTSDRPAEDLRMMGNAGFSDVNIINRVDRRIFRGLRYVEYGYHTVHYMITGVKRRKL